MRALQFQGRKVRGRGRGRGRGDTVPLSGFAVVSTARLGECKESLPITLDTGF